MSIIRARQGCVTRVLPNANSGPYIIRNYRPRAALTAANYHYLTTNSQTPPLGWIYMASGSLNMFISQVDADGINHDVNINTIPAGSDITVGPQTGKLVNPPLKVSGTVWLMSMTAWPVLANGDYQVSVTRA